MVSVKTWHTTLSDPRLTEALAEKIGTQLRGGEMIELVSDLGGGKTTFVRGLARGLGSNDHVSSPTFKINNVYHGTKFELLHFDFYRLDEPGIVAQELSEVVGDSHSVVVIEWGALLDQLLPKERLVIHFTATAAMVRTLRVIYPPSLAYLLKDVL